MKNRDVVCRSRFVIQHQAFILVERQGKELTHAHPNSLLISDLFSFVIGCYFKGSGK